MEQTTLLLLHHIIPPILMAFISILCTLVFCSMLVRILFKNWSSSVKKLRPGPRQLPIIGNIHQLCGSLPRHMLRDLAKEQGSLMHLQIGEISTIVISSPEFGWEIYKTHDIIFSQRARVDVACPTSIVHKGVSPLSHIGRSLKKAFVCFL